MSQSTLMLRRMLWACVFLFVAIGPAFGADAKTQPQMTAAQIVEKNVAARGGLAAWRAVQSIKWNGKLEAGGKQNVQLPFALEMKRPRKMRMELQFNGQTALQVYDGSHGWKLRPFLNRHEVEPYTPEEMKLAGLQSDLDGPLVDYAAKGNRVELEGMDSVEGRDAYRLKVTMKDGQVRRLWVDAQTFLDVKTDGSRRMDGKMHVVDTYFRDYRPVDGLMMPFSYETSVEGVKGNRPEKIIVESVVVNPRLDDALFTKPQ